MSADIVIEPSEWAAWCGKCPEMTHSHYRAEVDAWAANHACPEPNGDTPDV